MITILKTFILFILLSFGIINSITAQDSLVADKSSALIVRVPDTASIENFASDPDFQYQGVPENPDSFKDRFISQVIRFLNLIFGNPVGNFILRLILYTTIAFLVLVLVNQVIGGNLINVFNKKKSNSSFSLAIKEEEFQTLDLNALLNEAVQKSDYPTATRYLYLITLRMLDEHKLIIWGMEKTNIDYEREFSGHKGSTTFNSLTSYYEFVEYGDFEIDKAGYLVVDRLFNDLKTQVEA